jgi:hypothetical protein
MRTSRLVLAALGLALAGCAADTDERPATFEYIATAILRPGCATATCHSAMTRREDVDFSTVEASAETIDREALVFPGNTDPAESALINLLTTSGEKRMPIDGPLPQADIDLIAEWIIAGGVH